MKPLCGCAVASVAIFAGSLLLTANKVGARSDSPRSARSVEMRAANASRKLAVNYGKLPLSFETNDGQTDARVKFLARGKGYSLFLTSNEAVLALHTPDQQGRRGAAKVDRSIPKAKSSPSDTLRMHLVGANANAEVSGMDELRGKSNYFIGNDATKWRTNVPTYAKVRYRNVYPGIDLVYYGNQNGQLEYDFVVAPSADPSAIKLDLKADGRPLRIAADGDLAARIRGSELRFHKPIIYQGSPESRIDGSYSIDSRGRVEFAVGSYDHTKPLFIDPVLVYSTYLGGSNEDLGNAIALDANGDVYITGLTISTDFPTANPLQAALNTAGPFSSSDVFVAKLNSTGSALLYSTYLGGSYTDIGLGIVIDTSGDAYVTGVTYSTDFPTANPFQSTNGAGLNNATAFVSELNTSGSALIYSTYLGGSSTTQGNGIAVDSSGEAFVAGTTASTNFPTTGGALQTKFNGGTDGFLTKLNAAGSALIYSTYLGGRQADGAQAIALDSSGNAYVTGYTRGDFPIAGAAQPAYGGGQSDAFVTKLGASGALIYSTYLGGNNSDQGNGIAVDSSGSAYVTGFTHSTSFPLVSPFQASLGGTADAFVAKLTPTGSALVYSTYLGGSQSDGGSAIAVDSSGDAYVTGSTTSSNFPTANAIQSTYGGAGDAFVTELNSTGTALAYSTYLGGTGGDDGAGIAVDSSGDAYVVGGASVGFPTTHGSFQPGFGGGSEDVFVAELPFVPASSSTDFAISATPPSETVVQGNGESYAVTVNALNGFAGTVMLSASGLPSGANATFSPNSINTSGMATMSVTTSPTTPPGTYTITVTGTSGALVHNATVTLIVNSSVGAPGFSISATPPSITVARGQHATYTITVTAINGFNNSVTIGVGGVPANTTARLSNTTVTGSGSVSLVVATTALTPTGTFTLTITGYAGVGTHTTTVSLGVN